MGVFPAFKKLRDSKLGVWYEPQVDQALPSLQSLLPGCGPGAPANWFRIKVCHKVQHSYQKWSDKGDQE